MRATSGEDNLLVTEANGAPLTAVELRTPELRLMTVARITVPGGAMPASGWNERFDHVAGVLNLPPGHRLLAVFGADSAPDSWVERWGLLDLFLLSFVTLIALRLFGWIYAVVTFAAVTLVQQDDQLLVWLILLVLLAIVSMRAVPAGWPRSLATWARNLLFGALLLTSVPFAITQLRFALYPQLADPGGYVVNEPATVAQLGARVMGGMAATPAPNYAPPASTLVPPPPRLEEVMVTGAKRTANNRPAESSSSILVSEQRFAPGTLVQAGPGVPHWRYAAYPFNWSGPVDAAQTVNFLIVSPWLVGVWRVLGVVLLFALLVRVIRDNLDLKAGWQRLFASRAAAAASSVLLILACTVFCTPSRAYSTPDMDLLKELKTRLSRPPKCVPTCAEIMAARIALTPTSLEASFDVAALSSVAVALPTAGQRFDPDAIGVDGIAVPGVYRDGDRQIWIALKPGAHTVKLIGHLPAADSVQLLFP